MPGNIGAQESAATILKGSNAVEQQNISGREFY